MEIAVDGARDFRDTCRPGELHLCRLDRARGPRAHRYISRRYPARTNERKRRRRVAASLLHAPRRYRSNVSNRASKRKMCVGLRARAVRRPPRLTIRGTGVRDVAVNVRGSPVARIEQTIYTRKNSCLNISRRLKAYARAARSR